MVQTCGQASSAFVLIVLLVSEDLITGRGGFSHIDGELHPLSVPVTPYNCCRQSAAFSTRPYFLAIRMTPQSFAIP